MALRICALWVRRQPEIWMCPPILGSVVLCAVEVLVWPYLRSAGYPWNSESWNPRKSEIAQNVQLRGNTN
ncbi:unnamed protein product [Gulo gulo]|uniref:Uncharacterized protein n=1 Tax=Gulo gulo TaxID=48420 RepID=A0A9X9MDH6_GULGU|nr:unnamed protein product [Gulo gulo]